MYSYDDPLIMTHAFAPATPFTTDFASQPAATLRVLPTTISGDLGDNPNKLRQPRALKNARVLGISGIVLAAGTGTIQIGDGTTADRYGTITLDSTVTAGNSIVATIELTEEGCHMGVANTNPATSAFTLTFAGTATVTGLKLVYGHW